MKTLFLITARGGSKGIPKKNINPLNGVPLIHYSIRLARHFVPDECICVSTDDEQIASVAKQTGIVVPFLRPAELASDTAGSYEVMLHAINYFDAQGLQFDNMVLLQPTSPLRLKSQLASALDLYNESIDAVISVKETKGNPYQLLYEANAAGFLEKVMKQGEFSRRQDLPKVYEINGAIYIFNVKSLLKQKISEFKKIVPYAMPAENSVDIDTPLDWQWAEFLLQKQVVKLDYE